MIDHLSASQINLYIQCSLKYRYRYIDQIPPPFKPSGLVFGSVFHSTIEWFHKNRLLDEKVSAERLYRIFDAEWYCQKLDNHIRFKEGEDEMKLMLAGKEMLGLYLSAFHDEIKGAEVPFHVPLVNMETGEDLNIPLVGVIDLIESGDTVVEFKTSKQTFDSQTVKDAIQLTAYGYAYRILFGKDPQKLKIVNFVKTKKPKMVPLETSRDTNDYRRLFYLAQSVIKGIKAKLFYPKPSFMCKDCEYGEPCRAWSGND